MLQSPFKVIFLVLHYIFAVFPEVKSVAALIALTRNVAKMGTES